MLWRICVLLLALWSSMPASAINVFTVNSTVDPGTGGCNATECTLREAIAAANSTANVGGADEVRFNIAGSGAQRITLTTVLPTVTTPMLILGYTQPTASVNTLAEGSNAQLRIVLDAVNVIDSVNPVLSLVSAGSEVSGLVIVRKAQTGAFRLAQSAAIRGCWIGVEPDGVTLAPNALGIQIDGSSGAGTVGGPALADRNVIAAATSAAIQMVTLTAARVENNLIGLKPDGITPGSNATGVFSSVAAVGQELIDNRIACSSTAAISNFGSLIRNNRIGTRADGSGSAGCVTAGVQLNNIIATVVSDNLLANLSARTILLTGSARNIVFSRNRVYDNSTLPIDLLPIGHTGNDANDVDSGVNSLQNYPLLTDVQRVDDDTVSLSGTLNSTPSTSFRIEFFATARIDDGATNLNLEFGDAERIGGRDLTVTTDANGNASFGLVDIGFDSSGYIAGVAATATRLDGSANAVETSEIGPVRAAYEPGTDVFDVNNTETGGKGSFKQAFLEADAHPDAGSERDVIRFGIPGNGPHTITVAGLTNLISSGRLEIDGTSQPGWVENTATVGINAQLPIDINGVKMQFNFSPDAYVHGLVLRGPSAVLSLGTNGAVAGCFIGVSQDGNALSSTIGNTAQLSCTGACVIGGSTLAARNLIGADSNFSINTVHIQGNSARVEGNLVGFRRDGLTRLVVPASPTNSQGSVGVFVSSLTNAGVIVRNNTIGGMADGVRAEGQNALFENNRIGVGDDGVTAAGNSGTGVHLRVGANRIERNLVANSVRDGILVGGPSAFNSLIDNTVRDNGELGIDLDLTGALNGDGVTPNDTGDADIGGNNGQNYPVLSGLTRNTSSVSGSVSLNALANTSFRLRYCLLTTSDASGHGECPMPLTGLVQTVTTNGSGNFSGPTPVLPYSAGATGLTVTASRIAGIFEESSEYALVQPIRVATSLAVASTNPAPSTVGQAFTVSVQLDSADPAVVATGAVQVSAPGAGACTATVSNGSGACALTVGSAGPITISASFAGNASHGPSSASVVHSVNPASTSTAIVSDSPDPSTFGGEVTVSVSVGSAGGTVGGSVLVADGHGASCIATLANGSGSCALTPTQGGALTLSAAYAGNNDFLASSDAEEHQVVAVASQLQILSATPDPSVSGEPVNVSASLVSTVGTPAGPIVVSDSAGASCQIGGASGACILIPINAGSITLRADFAGNDTHLASSSSVSHQIDRAATTVQAQTPFLPGFPTEPPRQFAPLRVPAAVLVQAPGAGVATGTLTVHASVGIETCVIVLPALSCDLIPQTFGNRNFEIDYAGDSRFLPSSTSVEANVLPDRLLQDGFDLEE